MTEAMLDATLRHLRKKLLPLAKPEACWQVEIHGKGQSIQVKVTEIVSISDPVNFQQLNG